VLIVDDDHNLRKDLVDILQTKALRPSGCGTGRQALDIVAHLEVDVALIDLRLEDMSGLEVLRGLKQRSPDTECILVTGHASQAMAVEAVNLGAYSYMQKPFDMDQLLLTIRRAVEKRAAGRALAESVKNLEQAQRMGHLGNWDWDVASNRLTWSEELYTIFGMDKDFALTFANIEARFHPDDRAKNHAMMQALLAGLQAPEGELRIVRPDGSVRVIYQLAEVSCDAGGAIRIFGIMQDVTEQKRSEGTLRCTQFTVDKASHLIFWVVEDGTIVYANDLSRTLTGQDWPGLKIWRVSPHFSPETWRQRWESARQQKMRRLK
jgi:PAS domain S-box-containing protein